MVYAAVYLEDGFLGMKKDVNILLSGKILIIFGYKGLAVSVLLGWLSMEITVQITLVF